MGLGSGITYAVVVLCLRQMRSESRSPKYTTDWQELLTITPKQPC